jgi:hypothetical protein
MLDKERYALLQRYGYGTISPYSLKIKDTAALDSNRLGTPNRMTLE